MKSRLFHSAIQQSSAIEKIKRSLSYWLLVKIYAFDNTSEISFFVMLRGYIFTNIMERNFSKSSSKGLNTLISVLNLKDF